MRSIRICRISELPGVAVAMGLCALVARHAVHRHNRTAIVRIDFSIMSPPAAGETGGDFAGQLGLDRISRGSLRSCEHIGPTAKCAPRRGRTLLLVNVPAMTDQKVIRRPTWPSRPGRTCMTESNGAGCWGIFSMAAGFARLKRLNISK